MSLFAVLFRTAILFCLCKTQERPCVNHSGFRIGAVFIFLLVESNPITARFPLSFIYLFIWHCCIGEKSAKTRRKSSVNSIGDFPHFRPKRLNATVPLHSRTSVNPLALQLDFGHLDCDVAPRPLIIKISDHSHRNDKRTNKCYCEWFHQGILQFGYFRPLHLSRRCATRGARPGDGVAPSTPMVRPRRMIG